MRARGIDPGATIGWCDIERESAGVFRYVDGGTWDASTIQRACGLPCDFSGISVMAIETPEELHMNDARAAAAYPATLVQTVRNLLMTRALAERIACAAAPFVRIVEPTAAEVRHAIGVKLGAQRGRGPKLTADQQIAKIVPLAARGWPKRSNPHVRDAAAAAIWALQQAELGAAIERAREPRDNEERKVFAPWK